MNLPSLVERDILANFAISLAHLENLGTDVQASAIQDARMNIATPSTDVSVLGMILTS